MKKSCNFNIVPKNFQVPKPPKPAPPIPMGSCAAAARAAKLPHGSLMGVIDGGPGASRREACPRE